MSKTQILMDIAEQRGLPVKIISMTGQSTRALTHEEKRQMWINATIESPSAENCYLRGIADAENYYLNKNEIY